MLMHSQAVVPPASDFLLRYFFRAGKKVRGGLSVILI